MKKKMCIIWAFSLS